MPELKRINLNDAYAEWKYITLLPENENGLTNPFHGISYEDFLSNALPLIISYEHPVDMPDWFVPETYYYLWDSGGIVGEFRLRHHLTDALRKGAGHIGYSIKKECRGKGFGTEGLRLLLSYARDIVPEDEIYLRLEKHNTASLRVMEKNNARLAGEDEKYYYMRIPKIRKIRS